MLLASKGARTLRSAGMCIRWGRRAGPWSFLDDAACHFPAALLSPGRRSSHCAEWSQRLPCLRCGRHSAHLGRGAAVAVAVARSRPGSRAAPTLTPPFPRLLPAQLATKVAALFSRLLATMLVGRYPEGYPPHGVAQSWRDRLSRSRGCGQKAFITTWIQTPRCVDRLDHHDAGDRSPLPAKLLRASPRRKLGNRLMKRVIWGVLYKPKEMYT